MEFERFLLYSVKMFFVFLIFSRYCCCFFLICSSDRGSVDRGISQIMGESGCQWEWKSGCAARQLKKWNEFANEYSCCPPMKSARAPIFQLSPNFLSSKVRLQLALRRPVPTLSILNLFVESGAKHVIFVSWAKDFTRSTCIIGASADFPSAGVPASSLPAARNGGLLNVAKPNHFT